ncbi:alpha/beta hydrolase [Paracoccus fontiphilus]|uniref:Alpha/beta hydrolase n=1 Tax=Paracoccus fontiphilus TaxID=1815556 RepID=A0ABV7ILP0_9RHOB|nr:alpha/beta hydrolase [Paracoccus fontiphilus]
MTGSEQIWTSGARRFTAINGRETLPILVATPSDRPKGTVLLVHGRNGAPDQAQITEIANAYLAHGWRVAAPELPNSMALPDSGPPEHLTFSGHTRAAAAAWAWVARQWPDDLRALSGHSIGAYAIAHLAAASPETHHVLAVSPPLSGRVLRAAREAMGPPAIEAVKREAPRFFAEMEIADAGAALTRIKAPLAVITGTEDELVPLKDARAYFNAAPEARFFGALPGQHHCPAGEACGQMLAVALAALGA